MTDKKSNSQSNAASSAHAKPDPKSDPKSGPKPERIAKLLARAGVGSRREIERMIDAGRISLDGKILETPATLITSTHGIMVDGKTIAGPQRTRVWRYHKPRGMVTSHKDPEGRETVFANLPEGLPRVISVGRLDYNTEGLLLLTNDGGMARWMELPDTGWKRQYKVRVHGKVDEEALRKLRKGIVVDGVKYGSIDAKLGKTQGSNAWLTVAIREGKNREVRKVLGALGLDVTRLIRVAYGPFELGALDRGEVDEISSVGLEESVPDNLIYKGREKLSAKSGGAKASEGANTGRAKAKPKPNARHVSKKAGKKSSDKKFTEKKKR